MPYFLPPQVDFFPHPLLSDQDGLLAIGSELSVSQVLLAYQFGIFPWNHSEDPLLWWFTHPRCVLFPDEIKISKSMRPFLNGSKFNVSMDTAFDQVIQKCREINRKNQEDTWITDQLIKVFTDIHKMGLAHSVEVWEGEKLVGGLYGMALGKIFFGESMFAERSNTSKLALIRLVEFLKSKHFTLIDCQQATDHLISMGARLIEKEIFYRYLKRNTFEASIQGKWSHEM